MAERPVVCLPGLGANARLFGSMASAMPGVVVPPWPEPDQTDIESFSAACLASLRSAGLWRNDAIIVGFSFGGQVALSMLKQAVTQAATHAVNEDAEHPCGLLLLSSPRRTSGITPRFKRQVGFAKFVPDGLMARAASGLVAPRFGRTCGLGPVDQRELDAMARELDVPMFRALAKLAAGWRFEDADEAVIHDKGIPIMHLHAQEDPVIPPPPDHIVEGMRRLEGPFHLLPWTNTEAVMLAIQEIRDRVR